MAQRRMFSLRVIDTDDFLDMPQSTQLLYYNLAMRADDDGFVSSPKKIMKITGSNEDDMKVLAVKKYVIPFENGVCVIRHWRIHNLIRSDRYTATDYICEKKTLMVENGKYKPLNTNVIPSGNQVAPQVRLGKDRIGKVRLGEVSNIYVAFKNKINHNSKLTEKAETKIKARLKIFSKQELLKAIDNFSQDSWWMEHNASRGVAWFFHTDERIDQLINLKPRIRQEVIKKIS